MEEIEMLLELLDEEESELPEGEKEEAKDMGTPRIVYVPMFEPFGLEEAKERFGSSLVTVDVSLKGHYDLEVRFFCGSYSDEECDCRNFGDVVNMYVNCKLDAPLDGDIKIWREIMHFVDSYRECLPTTIYIWGPGIMYKTEKFAEYIKVPPGYIAFGSRYPYFMVKGPEKPSSFYAIKSYNLYVNYVLDRMRKTFVGEGKLNSFVDILNTIKTRVAYREDEILGVFLIVGPPGTGKTYGAKLFGNIVFGEGHFFRIDCGALSSDRRDFVASYLGAAKMYINTLASGYIFAAAHRMSSGILLLDEIEKAPNYLIKMLISILDEGTVVDARNNVIDLRNFIVIMTSNLGQHDIFGEEVAEYDDPEIRRQMFISNVRNQLPPEIRSRITRTYYFDLPTSEEKLRIAEGEIDKYRELIQKFGDNYDELKEQLIEKLKTRILAARDGREVERIVELEIFDTFSIDLEPKHGELRLR